LPEFHHEIKLGKWEVELSFTLEKVESEKAYPPICTRASFITKLAVDFQYAKAEPPIFVKFGGNIKSKSTSGQL
jgi:hypothetical protein